MARRTGGRRGRRGGGGHANDERWLLTYADMITLLMALFMVLFSISSVNKSKFETLQRALQEAFSGKVIPGGKSVQQTGDSADQVDQSTPEPPIASIQPTVKDSTGSKVQTAPNVGKENEDFLRLKREIDAWVRAHGLERSIETSIAERGLVIRLLTDRVLFASGSADLQPQSYPLLSELARLLRTEVRHPISVEGHTDSVPIAGRGAFPSNWELSASRAASVVRYFARTSVAPGRMSATGYANRRPLVSNATAAGRARNRRVEIVLVRLDRRSSP
jgi:chemotaxis protein MotB